MDIIANSLSAKDLCVKHKLTVNGLDISAYISSQTSAVVPIPIAPSTEAPSGSFADAKYTADFVNSSVNAFAAFYITRNASGDAFQTYAQLSSATQFYNAGEERTPTKNDYCIVLSDETKTPAAGAAPATRYSFQGGTYPDGKWEYQYTINGTAFTQAQLNALNSGATKDKIDRIDLNKSELSAMRSDISALSNTTNIHTNLINTILSDDLVDLSNAIPTRVSQLANDAGYLTSISLRPEDVSGLVQLSNYSKVDHKHMLSDVNDFDDDDWLSVDTSNIARVVAGLRLRDVENPDDTYKIFVSKGSLQIQKI